MASGSCLPLSNMNVLFARLPLYRLVSVTSRQSVDENCHLVGSIGYSHGPKSMTGGLNGYLKDLELRADEV